MDDNRAAAEEGDPWRVASEELALLEAAGMGLDRAAFLRGQSTPVFFGSALKNHGVQMLLDAIVDIAPSPSPVKDVTGIPRPKDAPFSGYVFKVQANMDPRHRDRVAFVRVCSGVFERGMTLTHGPTGRRFATSFARAFFGQDRQPLDDAYPGDVIGIVNASAVRVGDTVHGGQPVSFPWLPRFAPEHFARVHNSDVGRYKQFRRALEQLDREGVVQVLRRPGDGGQEAVLAAVGPMQFEIAAFRFKSEFDVAVSLEPMSYELAMRTDRVGARRVAGNRQALVLEASDGTLLVAFKSWFWLEQARRDHPDVVLEPLHGSRSILAHPYGGGSIVNAASRSK